MIAAVMILLLLVTLHTPANIVILVSNVYVTDVAKVLLFIFSDPGSVRVGTPGFNICLHLH